MRNRLKELERLVESDPDNYNAKLNLAREALRLGMRHPELLTFLNYKLKNNSPVFFGYYQPGSGELHRTQLDDIVDSSFSNPEHILNEIPFEWVAIESKTSEGYEAYVLISDHDDYAIWRNNFSESEPSNDFLDWLTNYQYDTMGIWHLNLEKTIGFRPDGYIKLEGAEISS